MTTKASMLLAARRALVSFICAPGVRLSRMPSTTSPMAKPAAGISTFPSLMRAQSLS
jgi:hypothetical protein